jgi:hypothetical protein
MSCTPALSRTLDTNLVAISPTAYRPDEDEAASLPQDQVQLSVAGAVVPFDELVAAP